MWMTAQITNKEIVWMHGEVKTPPFSKEARLETGFLLRKLQEGETLSMPQSRPMPSIGGNCHELRVIDKNETWRIVYHLNTDEIVILEVFSKKTKQTPKNVIENCKNRLDLYKKIR